MINPKVIQVCFLIFAFGCCRNSHTEVLSTADVWFDDPIQNSTGINWRKQGTDWERYASVQDPVMVAIHFKSGRVFMVYSKVTFLEQRDGAIAFLEVTPVRDLQSFDESVLSLEKLLAELGVNDNPLIKSKIDQWKNRSLVHSPFGGGSLSGEIEDGVHFYAEIKPHDTPLWYLSITLYASRSFPKPMWNQQ